MPVSGGHGHLVGYSTGRLMKIFLFKNEAISVVKCSSIVERYVDRVIAFYQGEIICDAPPAQALIDPRVRELVIGEEISTSDTGEGGTEMANA